MRSSTSSFEFRLAVFAAAFIGFVALAVWANRTFVDFNGGDGDPSKRAFFLRKIRPVANGIVVYGDSRTYQGVIPEVLSNALGRTCMNYAFSAGGMNDEMMRFLDARLRHTETTPGIVILGLSPLSLSVAARANELYRETKAIYERDGDPDATDGVSDAAFIKPYPLNRRLDRCVREIREAGGFESSDLGWQAWPLPADWKSKRAKTVRGYRSKFAATHVSEDSLDDLARWIGIWTGRGVRVFVFRVPTCREMVELEDRVSGCDMALVARRLSAAGGRWLDFDLAKYESSDGSHLSVSGAKELSRDLVDRIRSELEP